MVSTYTHERVHVRICTYVQVYVIGASALELTNSQSFDRAESAASCMAMPANNAAPAAAAAHELALSRPMSTVRRCHGDYCDGSLPLYFLSDHSSSVSSCPTGGGGRRDCKDWLLLLRHCQMGTAVGTDMIGARARARETLGKGKRTLLPNSHFTYAKDGSRTVGQGANTKMPTSAQAHHVPMDLVLSDRRRAKDTHNKRILVRATRFPADLTSGNMLMQCLCVESCGQVASEGLQVWAEYSGKVSSDVKFTLTSPVGTLVNVERYTDTPSHRTGIQPCNPSLSISLVRNLEVSQMLHIFEGEQVCGTWLVCPSLSYFSLSLSLSLSFSLSLSHTHTLSLSLSLCLSLSLFLSLSVSCSLSLPFPPHPGNWQDTALQVHL